MSKGNHPVRDHLKRQRLASSTDVALWYDITQDAPTEVVAQVEYAPGATPEQWQLTYYLFPGFVWASENHPTTRFDYQETASPPEPPSAETICVHQVTEEPGVPHEPSVVDEVDKGWYALMRSVSPPEQVGYVHVTVGPNPDQQEELWYITGDYQPIGPGVPDLNELLLYQSSAPGPFNPHTIYRHEVTIFPQGDSK